MATGDVLGRLLPNKPRDLRGDPAQSQRMEMGRIRSCCQGWTGLDDCCEERGRLWICTVVACTILFCFAFCCCFYLFSSCIIDESGMGPTPVLFYFWGVNPPRCLSLCLHPHFLFYLIAAPFSPLKRFSFAVCRTRCPCPCLAVWVVFRCSYDRLSCVACSRGCFSCPMCMMRLPFCSFVPLLFVL